jgi:hypothetical protein
LIFARGQVTYKKFNAPGKKTTRMRYSLEELRLLCFVLRCFLDGLYVAASDYKDDTASTSSDSEVDTSSEENSASSPDERSSGTSRTRRTYRIILTDGQIAAIRILLDLLETAKYNSKQLEHAISDLTETLYMPSNTADMAHNEFVSPVKAMYCLRAVSELGGFINPKYVTVYLVALQCGIRLCLLRVVLQKLREIRESGDASHRDQWFQ